MNILFYLTAFIPIGCLMGVSFIMVNDICPEQMTYELQQGCFDDAFVLPIIGMIISIGVVIVVFVSRFFNEQNLSSVEVQK